MSRWPGRLITRNPVTPGGSAPNASAPGIWTLPEMAYWKKQGLWPDASADAYWGYVSYLMATSSLSNASNNLFVDSSGAFNPVARVGNTNQGAVTPYGTLWSNYFDGSSYITMASGTAAGTGDFTIEGWFNVSSYSGGPGLYDTRPNTTNGAYPAVFVDASGYLTYYVNTAVQIQGATLVGINTWNHFALCRSGTSTRLFLNGVQQGSTYSDSNNYLMGGSRPIIGGNGYVPGGASQLTGYVSNIRVVNGTALYTTTFTPSTNPLTAISGTVLLTCQSNRFRDASTNGVAVSVSGAARVTPYSPFVLNAPGISYNQSDISYWSGYFDGNGDYLALSAATPLDLASSDFTIEGWVFPGTQTNVVDAVFGYGVYTTMLYRNGTTWTWEVGNGSSANYFTITATCTPNAWQHFALTRSGNTFTFWINGVSAGTNTTSNAVGTNGKNLSIGYNNSSTQFFTGYISNFRIVKGTAVYTNSFTPPAAPLTAVSGTSLLTLQNAAFTDNSTNNFVITANGNVTVTGNNPYQSGYYSNYFDGSGDGITAPNNAAFNLGSGNFTLECWVWNSEVANNCGYAGIWGGGYILYREGTTYRFYYGGPSGSPLTSSIAAVANAWTHLAVVRNGTTLTFYVNGVSGGSTNVSTTAINFSGQPFGIGANFETGSPGFPFTGYISNLRLVKGTAVYTSAFTPPTAPLTAISGTSLLTCQANRLIDISSNAFTLTKFGDTSVASFDPFYTATVASNGGSMYFDGSGDYLSAPSSPAFQFGTNDFTIEYWVNKPAAANGAVLDARSGGTGAVPWAAYIDGSNFPYFYDGTSYTSSIAVTNNAWNHVAIVRTSGVLKIFVNGVQGYSAAYTASLNATGSLLVGGTAAYMTGYLSDIRIVKGTAVYTSAFTPPTAPLTPSANTTLLLNGMNAGTYDAAMQNDLETVGNARVTSAQAKYGTTSAYIPDATSLLKGPLTQNTAFGTGDFTVEAWIYSVATTSGYTCIFTSRDGVTSQANTVFFGLKPNTNQLTFYTSSEIIGTSTAVSTGVWTHVALVRNSGATAIYINGTSAGTATFTTALTGTGLAIGNEYSLASSNGGLYVDDLRITKGYARYTANFTPPTAALPIY